MKSRVLTAILAAGLLVAWNPVYGQNPTKFGLKAGLSLSTIDTDAGSFDFETRTAFAGGVSF